jgi:23S rRNA (guanosine2251-2'-O)-methyltransferase
MPGNSQRRGAIRKSGTKGAHVGSGGQRRKALEGRGATPPKEARAYHPAAKKAAATQKTVQQRAKLADLRRKQTDGPELVLGRNPVLECMRVKAPATALYVVAGTDSDDRLKEIIYRAADTGISILEVPRTDLDRMTTNGLHQGVALQVPPYRYRAPEDLMEDAVNSGLPGLIVVLDNITDPRNLGAVIRSTAAFGGNGVVIPERRSASVTAVAWRTSAGAAARLPVARATNLTRTLKMFAANGYFVVGLDTEGAVSLDDFTSANEPLVVVVGSEGKGLSRLVRETCDAILSVPIASAVESLNASVAAGIVLSDIARQRRRR